MFLQVFIINFFYLKSCIDYYECLKNVFVMSLLPICSIKIVLKIKFLFCFSTKLISKITSKIIHLILLIIIG